MAELERRRRQVIKKLGPKYDWYGKPCLCPKYDAEKARCPEHPRAHKYQRPPKGDWLVWNLCGGRGSGKRLAIDTPIPTPTGWTTMGEIRVGDEVFDEAGRVCKVTWVSDIELRRDSYRIAFSDGSTLDACGEHQWVTWTHSARKALLRSRYDAHDRFPEDWPKWRSRCTLGARQLSRESIRDVGELVASGMSLRKAAAKVGVSRQRVKLHLDGSIRPKSPVVSANSRGPEIRTTDQIRETLTIGSRGDTNHCIPNCLPLELPEIHLPVDPYVMGAWAGDGSKVDGTITQGLADHEFMRSQFEAAGFPTTDRSDPINFGTIGLAAKLKSLGVIGDKHIPEVYLRASASQRLALLQGLMDTDGGRDGRASRVSFTSTRKCLADAVEELAVSLGMRVTRDQKRAVCNGKDCGVAYRVCFTPTMQVFRLPRKADRLVFGGPQSLRRFHRMIESVEPIPPRFMRCIAVDSPNRMYLAGRQMIPTHNTRAAAEWIRSKVELHAANGEAVRIALVNETVADVRKVMVEGDSGILAISPEWFKPVYRPSTAELVWPNGSVAYIYSSETPEALRGPQHHYGWCLDGDTMVRMADGSERPLRTIREGDHVLTRSGPRRVLAWALTRKDADVFRVETDSGHSIVGTADHPVFVVGKGFVPIGELIEGEDHCVIAASSTADASTTSGVAGTTRPTSDSTERSGRTPTGRSPRDGTSTTRTATSSTIAWRTWNSSRSRSTAGTTLSSESSPTATSASATRSRRIAGTGIDFSIASWSASTAAPSSPLSPTFPRGSAPTAAWRRPVPGPSWARIGTAGTAASDTGRSLGPRSIAPRSATTGPACDASRTWSSGTSPAATAGPSFDRSGPTPSSATTSAPGLTTRIATVSRCPTSADVYDIAVEGAGEFYANGILVHNCDELAKWRANLQGPVWDNLVLGMRLGEHPQIAVTSTPQPTPVYKSILRDPLTVVTGGSTYENLDNLAASFRKTILAKYEGTRLGRQELYAELLDDNPNALWRSGMLDELRVNRRPSGFKRIVIGVDPAGKIGDRIKYAHGMPVESSGDGDEAGIVVVGLAEDDHAYVIGDHTTGGSPDMWGRAIKDAYERHKADVVVWESNHGGDTVAGVITATDPRIAHKKVYASRSKYLRAEPVAALYEQGKVHHVGEFSALETEMCEFVQGQAGSPNRVDALVFAITELMLGGEVEKQELPFMRTSVKGWF